MNKERLGGFVAEHRKEMGLTQKELAAVLHVTDKAVSKWERGLSYPDVTLLEPLAAALDLRLEELMACRKSKKEGSTVSEETRNLLELSADSLKTERRRGRKLLALLAVLLVILVVGAAGICFNSFKTETRRNTIYLKETEGTAQYLYVKENGHLLRLECGDGVDFDAVTADDVVYALECRWNKRTYEGTVTACEPTGAVFLGTLMDAEEEIQKESLFGHPEVYYRCENYMPNLYAAETGIRYTCEFRCWLWDLDTDWQETLLLVEDCINATVADLDGDGEKEVVARTCWPEKPYTVYDWVDGEIVQTWPKTVREEIQEDLVAIWER